MNLFYIESIVKDDVKYERVETKTLSSDKFRLRKRFARNVVAEAFKPFGLDGELEVHLIKLRPIDKQDVERFGLLIMPKQFFKELGLEPRFQVLKEKLEKR